MRLVNIYNKGRKIYLFCRDEKGNQVIDLVENFYPYYYEPSEQGSYKSFDGKKLRKIDCVTPYDLTKQKCDTSYEADIHYCKRYLIDKVDVLEKCPIKYTMIDIEVQAPDLPNAELAIYPISSITIYNSFTDKTKTWFLLDWQLEETKMLEDFVTYMKNEKFDLWLIWHEPFDYPYLYNRYATLTGKCFAQSVSPTKQFRKTKNMVLPAGISVCDYLVWYKRVFNNLANYDLDSVFVHEFGNGKIHEVEDFNELNEELKLHNIEDVEGMVKIEKSHKLVELFDEIRRFGFIEFEDLGFNSRIIDMLLLKEAKKRNEVLPMKNKWTDKNDQLEGAYREAFELGIFFDIGKYDLGSAYPLSIAEYCLDSANIVDKEDIDTIKVKVTDRASRETIVTHIVQQNQNRILPIVVKQLIAEKTKLKKIKKEINPESPEYDDINSKYEAVKSIVNSAYGVIALKAFRLFDNRVASMVTSIIRDLLHYVSTKVEEKGYKVIYLDTDSVFVVDGGKDISELLNELILEWSEKTFGQPTDIKFEYEGKFERLLILAKCHYKGYLCVDSQTQALTLNGWKFWSELKCGQKIATYNKQKQIIEYQPIEWINSYEYDDFMYKLGNSKSLDILVTPNHKNLIQTLQGNEQFKTCQELLSRDKIRVLAPVHYCSNYSVGKDWAYLIGWILSEGHYSVVRNHKSITICQSHKANPDKCKKIRNCLNRTKLKYTERYSKDCIIFYLSTNPLVDWVFENVPQKCLNRKLLSLPINELKMMLQSLLEGDGHYIKKDTWEFWQKDKTFIEWFEILAMRCGYHTNTKNKDKCFDIHLSKKQFIGIRSTNGKILNIKQQKYKGIVWCPTVKNKAWIAKRNGKVFITGNSTPKGVKEEIKGIEVKRSNSTKFMKYFQNELIEKVLNKESKEDIVIWIKTEIERIKTLPLMEIGFPCKLARPVEEYTKKDEIFVRALRNTQRLIKYKKKIGERYYWIPIKPEIDDKGLLVRGIKEKAIDVIAFDKKNIDHVDKEKIDWYGIIDKNIIKKVSNIFEVMKWDIEEIIPEKLQRERIKKTAKTVRKLIDLNPDQFKFDF